MTTLLNTEYARLVRLDAFYLRRSLHASGYLLGQGWRQRGFTVAERLVKRGGQRGGGAHDASTAEWVVAAILAAVRDLPYFALEQAAQRWSYRFTDSLAGKTVLIVGYGSIGRAVERRLAGFEVEVSRVARRARDGVAPVSDLPGLLPTADVVVILAPVTAETIGMVDASFLARMKDGALLVNAARGSLVVTDALVAELRQGRLRAAVDVTDPEPLGPGHPLWEAPGLLITPHVAASTPVSAARSVAFVRAQAGRFIGGQPLQNVIAGKY